MDVNPPTFFSADSLLNEERELHAQPFEGGVAARLQSVDWSFGKRARAPAIEAVHPYPAKFIGDIPRTFLELLPIPASTAVLDPFCGSGTTLVEAQRAGRNAVGIDLNPIACLMSRVKTSPLAAGFTAAAEMVATRAINLKDVALPDIPNIDHWFKHDVQRAVAALSREISQPTYEPWSDQLRLALSSILVRVSNQDSDTRYAAVEKNISWKDVFSSFLTAATKLERALSARDWPLTTAQVLQNNVLTVTPNEIQMPIGLVVTSPPYPNAYEYWLYHKYRMWWLGFDPIAVKEAEIGARAHFFKKNHHTAEMFIDQMRTMLTLVREVLVRSGFACIVVGRSKIHGKLIDNGMLISNVGNELGFELFAQFERPINSVRKSFNLSHANIKTETVLVLRKP